MKVIAYEVVEAVSAVDLQNGVTDMIAEGWQPWGSMVSTCVFDSKGDPQAENMYQAMVKYQE